MSEIKKLKFEKEITDLINKRHDIPDEFWINTDDRKYQVIWFIDRQRPSVSASYDFDVERFGLTRDGKIIWGFDSGCSCPTPWESNPYDVKEFKQFCVEDYGKAEMNEKNRYDVDQWFDEGWEDDCFDNLNDYLLLVSKDLKPEQVLDIKNSEIRRYLIKRIGYENIKDKVKAEVIHVDGHNELLKFANGEMYVKVRDHSTEREYLLFVEGGHKTCRSAIAWTFGLSEEEYNPIIET